MRASAGRLAAREHPCSAVVRSSPSRRPSRPSSSPAVAPVLAHAELVSSDPANGAQLVHPAHDDHPDLQRGPGRRQELVPAQPERGEHRDRGTHRRRRHGDDAHGPVADARRLRDPLDLVLPGRPPPAGQPSRSRSSRRARRPRARPPPRPPAPAPDRRRLPHRGRECDGRPVRGRPHAVARSRRPTQHRPRPPAATCSSRSSSGSCSSRVSGRSCCDARVAPDRDRRTHPQRSARRRRRPGPARRARSTLGRRRAWALRDLSEPAAARGLPHRRRHDRRAVVPVRPGARHARRPDGAGAGRRRPGVAAHRAPRPRPGRVAVDHGAGHRRRVVGRRGRPDLPVDLRLGRRRDPVGAGLPGLGVARPVHDAPRPRRMGAPAARRPGLGDDAAARRAPDLARRRRLRVLRLARARRGAGCRDADGRARRLHDPDARADGPVRP